MRELRGGPSQERPSASRSGSEDESSSADDDEGILVVQPPVGGLQLARQDTGGSPGSSDGSSDSFGADAEETLRVLRGGSPARAQPQAAAAPQPQHQPARRRLEPALDDHAPPSSTTEDDAAAAQLLSPGSQASESAISDASSDSFVGGLRESRGWQPETPREGEDEESESDEDYDAGGGGEAPSSRGGADALAAAKRRAESADRAGIMGSAAGMGSSLAAQVAATARGRGGGSGLDISSSEAASDDGSPHGSSASSFGATVGGAAAPAAQAASPDGSSSEDSFAQELLREASGREPAEGSSEEGSSEEGSEESSEEGSEEEESSEAEGVLLVGGGFGAATTIEEEEEVSGSSEEEADRRSGRGEPGEEAIVPGLLPEGWTEVEAEDGRAYFWNEVTEEVTWDRPAPPSPAKRPAPAKRSMVPPPPRRGGLGEAPVARHPHLGQRAAGVPGTSTRGRAAAAAAAAARAGPSTASGEEPSASAAATEADEQLAGSDEEQADAGAEAYGEMSAVAVAAARRRAEGGDRAGIMGAGAGMGSSIASEVAAAALGGGALKRRAAVQAPPAAPAAAEEAPEWARRRRTSGEAIAASVASKQAQVQAAFAAAKTPSPEKMERSRSNVAAAVEAVMSSEKGGGRSNRQSSSGSPEKGKESPTKAGRRTRTESMESSLKHRRESGLSMQALLNEQQRHLKQERAALALEQEAHADRMARLEAREAKVRAAEATLGGRKQELEAWHEQLTEYEAEQHWEHWRRDGMRNLMTELVRKVPRDEWKARMQRALTQLELLKRENLRLRQELAAARAMAGGSPPRRVGGGGAGSVPGTPAMAAATPGGTPAAADAMLGFGSVSDELLAQNASLQAAAARAEEELLRARKLEASREGYLGVLQRESHEAQARNDAQQRRLEVLTAENSKLKKETTRLRGEVSSSRMDGYEKELMQTELSGAKDAATAMHAQLARLHAENTALRDGDGLRRELKATAQQLAEALEQKATLGETMRLQVLHARVEQATALAALVDAEADAEGHYVEAVRRAQEGLRVQKRGARAQLLARLWTQLRPAARAYSLAWALSTWHSAALFSETGVVFGEMRDKITLLASCTERLAGEVEVLQLSEAGGLQLRHLSLLHDNWKDVLLGELRGAEAEAEGAKAELHQSRAKLQRRDDDLVLMIERYEGVQAEQRQLTARVAAASDGSALHLARLQAEKSELQQQAEATAAQLAEAQAHATEAHELLALRERQLAVMLQHVDASKGEATEARRRGSGDVAQLRAALAKRQAELVSLVRELYQLAAAEKDATTISFVSRSRLFSQSAAIYKSLGPELFADDAENAGPPVAGEAEAAGRALALPQPTSAQ